ELADHESMLGTLEQRRKDNETVIERLRQHKSDLEGQIMTLEKILHIDSKDLDMNKSEKTRLEKETKKLDKDLDAITLKVSSANKDLAKLKIEKQKLREQISKMRSPEILAQLTSFEEKEGSIKEHLTELKGNLKTNDSQLKSVLGPEARRIQDILKQHEKEESDFRKERSSLKDDIVSLDKELKEKEKLEQKFLSQFKGLFKNREEAQRKIDQAEVKEDHANLAIREFEIKNTSVSMELARVKAELAGLEEEGRQYEDAEPFKGKNIEDCKVEIRQFERMLEGIGAVNMKALEVYDSVEREFRDLVTKKDKLGLERQDVLVMINEIDSRKTEIFMKTFTVLDENFQRIFGSLSTKGHAFLEIENEKDIFSGGVMIKVRLTGKKFMDIRSLSGGEKTMTALAFLFAVQEHEPAHFYILDEVDAALDKHNSEKLSKLVRAYCKNAQYVIISHNDAVISEADNLYGISMNEHGISKVTTLAI
ncbi:hypothetical protein GOV11_05410, partial [Candidatus Woesearchaeota archaeon]|nr:hypothetical protein [Candidatus Woesearchaeota archaeon]